MYTKPLVRRLAWQPQSARVDMADRRGRLRRHALIVEEVAGNDREAERVSTAVGELLASLGHLEAAVTVTTLESFPGKRSAADTESDEAFLAQLRTLGENWRYSDEFIGLIVRRRFPRKYDDLRGRP